MKQNKVDEIAEIFDGFECLNSEDQHIIVDIVDFYKDMADHYRRVEHWLEDHAKDEAQGLWAGQPLTDGE